MGTLQKRGNRWRAMVRRTDLCASKTFARKVDAAAWVTATEREADLGSVRPKKMEGSLASVIDQYEKVIGPQRRWSRSKQYELDRLRADLGPTLLAHLSRQAIIDYGVALAKTYGPQGTRTRLGYLAEVLRTTRSLWGLTVPLEAVEQALAALSRQKIIGRGQPRTRRPTIEELEAIIAHSEASKKSTVPLADIVRILSTLPIRSGELIGVEWADIDQKARTVVLRARKHPDFRAKADEVIPLIAFDGIDTFEILTRQPRWLPRPFPHTRQTVSNAFWLAAKSCGIKDLHMHDLRAYSLSRLLEANVGIPQVALISGHRNWHVLSRHYARLTPEAVHAAVAQGLI
jgi:integrase